MSNPNLRGTPTPSKLMAKANSSAKLMNAMKDLNLNGQSAVAKYYNHVDLEVRNFVKDLCDAGFSPAEPKPQDNPFSRPMSHYVPRSIMQQQQPSKIGGGQEYYPPEADENYEPYGRVQGSNVAIRGGWPTEQAYASQPGNINGMARQRPF